MHPIVDLSSEEIVQTHRDSVFMSWKPQEGAAESAFVPDIGEGVYFYVDDGEGNPRRVLDFSSQLMYANLGHGPHEAIIDAVMAVLKGGMMGHAGMAHAPRAMAAQAIKSVLPHELRDGKILFTLGGAEAVENAILIARQFTGRRKIVTRYRSYHGATMGAMHASGDPRRFANELGSSSDIVRIWGPHEYRQPTEGDLQSVVNLAIQTMEFEGPQNIAAILLEGVTGSSGILPAPKEWWWHLREFADRHGILIISDEVMSGFGRTGKWFGIEHSGIQVDMITMAKGLTCGHAPLGAVAVSPQIAKHFESVPFVRGLTWSGNPVSCAAAWATIQEYKRRGLLSNAQIMGEELKTHLALLKRESRIVGDVRSIGLFGIIECVADRETKEPLSGWNKPASLPMQAIAKSLREQGMHTFVKWDWIFVVPPLCITSEELTIGIDMIRKALDAGHQTLLSQQLANR